MNGFHSRGRDISAHESASTTGKNSANWTVGKSKAGKVPGHQDAAASRTWASRYGPSVPENVGVRCVMSL